MRKRAWLLFFTLLFLILGAVQVHKWQVNQKAERFRVYFIEHAPIADNGKLAEVNLTSEKNCLGLWEGKKLKNALQNVQFAWNYTPWLDPGEDLRSFQIVTGSRWIEDARIELMVGADQGWAYFAAEPQGQTSVWALKPSSCRALKQQIWKDFGDQLLALSVEHPK